MRGNSCPKCSGQLVPDNADPEDLSCVQCGYIVYAVQAIEDENDRRNLLDNRQAEKPYEEYRRALSPEDFARMLKEIGIDDPAKADS